jgi:single-strand DNA-binding protein
VRVGRQVKQLEDSKEEHPMARNNSFTLRGFVGKDAEVKTVGTGTTLAQFNLCVEERWQTRDGQAGSKKDWFKLTAWGRQAEIAAERIVKGALVEVHGRLENRSWERDGQKHYATDLVVSELVFIDRTTGQPIAEPVATPSAEPVVAEPPAEDETPVAEAPKTPKLRRCKQTA